MKKTADLDSKHIVLLFTALIALGILVQIGAVYVMNGILMGVQSLSSVNEEYTEISGRLSTMDFRHIAQVILISPVAEEFVFRFIFVGLIMKTIKNIRDFKGSFWCVNIVASLLFGIYHMNIVQFVYAFILGLMLGFIFYNMGGYAASLIVHISINTAGLYLAPLLPGSMSPVVMCVIGIVVLVGAVLFLYYLYRKIFTV